MNKLEIANELLKNSPYKYIQEFIRDYIFNLEAIEQKKCQNKELMRFDNCISYIKEVQFDINDWMLFDIPIFYSHCFFNKKTKQAFDLAVWDIGNVIPRYLDSGVNEQDADTIDEAIKKYDIRDYLKANI